MGLLVHQLLILTDSPVIDLSANESDPNLGSKSAHKLCVLKMFLSIHVLGTLTIRVFIRYKDIQATSTTTTTSRQLIRSDKSSCFY